MHLGWVPHGSDGYRGQMAVLVKPNGLLGSFYMAAIAPFRHAIVYPRLMREVEKRWRALAETYDPPRILVGEAYVLDIDGWARFYGSGRASF